MTTLPSYPGYEVEKDLGIIWAFDRDFVPLRNLWQMDEPLERTMKELWKKAVKTGANAVLGIQLSISSERNIPILTGTAVILKKKD